MTPLELGILLHYYSHANDYRDGDFSYPAVHDAINWLTESVGMLKFCLEPCKDNENRYANYELTEKGKFYVEYICSIPFPVAKWEIPNEKPGTDHV